MMLCEPLEKSDLPFFLAVSKTGWIAEEKLDGDRILMTYKDGKVKLTNRRGADVTDRYPEFADFKAEYKFVADGEMCVLDENGVSQFNEGISFRTHCVDPSTIRAAASEYPVTLVLFDCLEFCGADLKGKKWLDRRHELEALNLKHQNIQISKFSYDIKDMWDKVTAKGGEGVILKKDDSVYQWGKRSSSWRKVKNIKEVDLSFTKYDVNPKGITVENEAGIRCLVSGYHSPPVKEAIDLNGKVTLTIRHLGQTKAGKYRQPTFMKLVEEETNERI